MPAFACRTDDLRIHSRHSERERRISSETLHFVQGDSGPGARSLADALLIDCYLDGLIAERGCSVNTLQSYRHDLDKLCAYLKTQERDNAASLTRDDVPRLLEFLKR